MSILYVNTITPNTGDTVTLSGSLTTTGKLTIGDADTDTVAITAELTSSIIPDINNTFDLGSSTKQWKDIHIDGIGFIDTIITNDITSSGNISSSGEFIGNLTGTASLSTTAQNLGTDLTPTLEEKTSGFTAVAGYEYIVSSATGLAVALPNAAAGARITIVNKTTVTSGNITITAAGGDLLKGYAFLEATDAANNKSFFAPDGTDDLVITLNGSTKGGLVGDRIELVGISATEWRVRATLSHTGTAATPFS
tara:strand:+ start:4207 stop:4962 length:756 start_codon:yes stop_codon:yes gene_type:complete